MQQLVAPIFNERGFSGDRTLAEGIINISSPHCLLKGVLFARAYWPRLKNEYI